MIFHGGSEKNKKKGYLVHHMHKASNEKIYLGSEGIEPPFIFLF